MADTSFNVFDTHICIGDACVKMMRDIETISKKQ